MPFVRWGRRIFSAIWFAIFAWDAAAERIEISAPDGWKTSIEDDLTIVDVFFNGRKIASTPARFNAETLTFEDPVGLANLIPGIRETELIAHALNRPHQTNETHACTAPNPTNPCGYIYPKDVAIIFNPVRLDVEIFINDLYTYFRDPRARHLPAPTVAPGILASVDTRTAYDFDGDRFIGAYSLGAIAGRGRKSVRARLLANTSSEAQLQSLQATHVGPETAWTVGLQSTPFGGSLSRTRQLLGFRWGSTLLTRTNKAHLNASLLEISVAQNATVEIQRDGQTLDVQQIAPGQTQLETTRLPSSSYTVDLLIEEGGETRIETRYFSTSSRLPPGDAPQWYFEVGQAVPFASQNGYLFTGGTPIIAAGRQQRIGANTAIKIDAAVTDDIRFLELRATTQTELIRGSIAWLTADDGTQGFAANANARLHDWTVYGSYRKLDVAGASNPIERDTFVPFTNSFEQASVSANRRNKWGRFGFRTYYRKDSMGQESWFGGPYVDLTLLTRRRWRLNMSLRQDWGSERKTRFFGLRLSKTLERPGNSISRPRVQARIDSNVTQNSDTGEVSSVTVAETTLRADLTRTSDSRTSVFGAIRHQDQLGARAEIDYSSPWLKARFDGRHNYQSQNTALFDVRSGLVFSGHGTSLTATREEAGAQMRVTGPPGNPVAVQVDRRTRAVAKSGRQTFVPLRGFSISDVSIQPEHTRNLDYQQHTDRLVVYPGNVIQLTRSVRPITIIFARLVDPAGTPIPNAFLEFEDTTLGTTGPDGYFQIDASPGDRIIVRLSKKESCEITLPAASNPSDAYLDAGTLTCRPLSADSP